MTSSPITEATAPWTRNRSKRENTGFGAESHEQKPHMNVHSIALEAQDVHVLVGANVPQMVKYKRESTKQAAETLDLTVQEQKKQADGQI